jgi:hypothetical protein
MSMTGEPVSEPGDEWRYSPFGAGGYEVGNDAILLLDELQRPVSPESGGPLCWDETDVDAFENLVQLDIGIRFISPDPDMDGVGVFDLHGNFQDLFGAVPFTEGERRWMYEPPADRYERGLGELVGKTGEIMEAGVLRVVQGRDLARRWWAWRRECDEFAGQGGLTQAREALGSMSLKLVREAYWPSCSMDMLSQLRDGQAKGVE